jgi:hypothetical protein
MMSVGWRIRKSPHWPVQHPRPVRAKKEACRVRPSQAYPTRKTAYYKGDWYYNPAPAHLLRGVEILVKKRERDTVNRHFQKKIAPHQPQVSVGGKCWVRPGGRTLPSNKIYSFFFFGPKAYSWNLVIKKWSILYGSVPMLRAIISSTSSFMWFL